jgi:DNA gyrase/topoisomerase IV subunit B
MSYLGMWLDSTLPQVLADIRDDRMPEVTMTEVSTRVAEILATAEQRAKDIVAKAVRLADEIDAQSQHRATLRRDQSARAIAVLRRSISEIESIG